MFLKTQNGKIAHQIIKNTNGRFFTVWFTKKDGTERKLNGRVAVRKHVKNGTLMYNPADYGMIVVYDVQPHGGYRMVTLDNVNRIKANGQIFDFRSGE